jgi:hypothetical protein
MFETPHEAAASVSIGMDDGLREIPAGPTHAVSAVRSRVPAGIPDTDKSLLFCPADHHVGPRPCGRFGGANDRDNVMEQKRRKEHAISRRRINGPRKNHLLGKMADRRNSGTGRERLHDENVTEAIKSRSSCV